eukprot:TRINITY_DN5800_c0_g1_i2.p1 TRINITY_DN5800_c0_g1~~TRINITY_DN5800_c0_g1_i2.p1  ORF type:complete len:188 (+),score=19.53 TRINITY_DN5800_c0_g1_i2:49-612(+)
MGACSCKGKKQRGDMRRPVPQKYSRGNSIENDAVIARVLSADEIVAQQIYLERKMQKMAQRRERHLERTHRSCNQNRMQFLSSEYERHKKKHTKTKRPPRQRPAPSIRVNALDTPVVPASPSSRSHSTAAANECIICYESKAKCNPQYLPCIHGFHRECIREWVENSPEPTCPVCSTEIPPEVVAAL